MTSERLDVLVEQLRQEAVEIATAAGLTEPETWPWRTDTTEGYGRWLAFVQQAPGTGLARDAWCSMWLREQAAVASQPTELVDRYARAAQKLRQGKDWPTQEAVAEELGVTDRQVRNVGWKQILSRADELAKGGSSG